MGWCSAHPIPGPPCPPSPTLLLAVPRPLPLSLYPHGRWCNPDVLLGVRACRHAMIAIVRATLKR